MQHPAPLTVLALGSSHGDDRAAWNVVRLLNADPEFDGKCVTLASPWDVTAHVGTAETVVIVDACQTGAAGGTIHQWPACELPADHGTKASTHGGSLAEAFALARTLGYDLSGVVVYGIEAESTAAGAELSPAVRQAAEELARQLRIRRLQS